MNKENILFVSHRKAQCGVYEFGTNIFDVLKTSSAFNFIRVECSSITELRKAIDEYAPSLIIYNYHPSVLQWVAKKIVPRIFQNNIADIKIPQIGIIHEITQQIADSATNYRNKIIYGKSSKLLNSLFDYYIAPDPTLLLKNPIVFKTGRLVPSYNNQTPAPENLTIGSFGFGTANKGFENIITLVQKEFDKAIIRFNIPFADFGDKNGEQAKKIAAACQALIYKPDIKLEITHDFFSKEELLEFLSENTINVFLYEDTANRGISSTTDYALAVKKPIAISNSSMFRNLSNVKPSICINNNSLKTIIENGFAPLEKKYEEYSKENILWEYERIIISILK